MSTLRVRPSTVLFAILAVGGVAFGTTCVEACLGPGRAAVRLARTARLAERLQLTDLCLFTEARYTRNPALADLHTPFQDHPTALEHFPSGTLVAPPPHLTSPHAWHPAPHPKHP